MRNTELVSSRPDSTVEEVLSNITARLRRPLSILMGMVAMYGSAAVSLISPAPASAKTGWSLRSHVRMNPDRENAWHMYPQETPVPSLKGVMFCQLDRQETPSISGSEQEWGEYIPARHLDGMREVWDGWLIKGHEAIAAKDWKKGEQCFREASKYGELRDGDLITLTVIFRLQKRYMEGLEVAKANYARYPNLSSAEQLCLSYCDVGDFSRARLLLGRIIQIEKDYKNSLRIRGLITRAAFHDFDISVVLDAQLLGHYDGRPEFNKNGYFECYVPPDVPNQRCEVKAVECLSFEEVTDRAGNRCLRIRPDGANPVRVQLRIIKIPVQYNLEENRSWLPYKVPTEVECYLGKTPGIDPSTQLVGTLAEKLRGNDELATVNNVIEWVPTNIKASGPVPPDVDCNILPGSEACLRSGVGACGPQAAAMCAILRRCGIPSRMTVGFVGLGDNPILDWHTWIEVYFPKFGWLSGGADTQVGGLSMNLVRLAAGADTDSVNNRDNTCGRVFSAMFNQDPKTGKAENITGRLSRVYLDLEDPVSSIIDVK